MKDTFFHKSHRPQRIACDPAWTNLEYVIKGVRRRRFTADRNGVLEADFYCPLELVDLPGMRVARFRLVREEMKRGKKVIKAMDPTGYDERVLLPTSDGFARIRFTYHGVAEKGRTYVPQLQIVGGPAEVYATGTHYSHVWRR